MLQNDSYSGADPVVLSAYNRYMYAFCLVVLIAVVWLLVVCPATSVKQVGYKLSDSTIHSDGVPVVLKGDMLMMSDDVFRSAMLGLKTRLNGLNVSPETCRKMKTELNKAKRDIIKFISDNGCDSVEELIRNKEYITSTMNYARARYSNDLNDDDTVSMWQITEYLTFLVSLPSKRNGRLNIDLIEALIDSASEGLCSGAKKEGLTGESGSMNDYVYTSYYPSYQQYHSFPQISPYKTRQFEPEAPWSIQSTDVRSPNSRRFLSELDHLAVAGDGNNIGAGDSYINNIRNPTQQGQSLLYTI